MSRLRSIAPRALSALALAACGRSVAPEPAEGGAEEPTRAERERMVERQLAARDIRDERVLAAMRAVPRHRFVLPEQASEAYADHPLPLAHGQTISQPYIVAYMTQAAELAPGARVLEVGTGSGYQAAVLAEMVTEVWTIEIIEPLAESARATLQSLGYDRVHVRSGDGYRGWPEAAPFDAILVTAAPDHVPEPLLEQLAPGGRLVLPVGDREEQTILRIRRTAAGFEREELLPVRFVPMTGEAER